MNCKMKGLSLDKIAGAVGGQLYYGNLYQEEITGVEMDSRRIEEGNLFVAIKGSRVDGHHFVENVMAAGASCVLVEEAPRIECPYILVDSTTKALGELAAYYRQQLDIKIIGITGSVGKTSTKEMLRSILSQSFAVESTKGNYNNEIGLPLTLLTFRSHHQIGIVEMGISDFGEMERLSYMAKPDIGIITNIGDCHLENLKTREGVLKAKSELFIHMNKQGSIILNGEDPLLASIQQVGEKHIYHYGFGKDSDVYGEDVSLCGLEASQGWICLPDGQRGKVDVPLPGDHMFLNALAGFTCGYLLGMSIEQMAEGVYKAAATKGRSNIITLQDKKIIDDCYNANPVSVAAALKTLNQSSQGRRVAILGDMLELGGDEIDYHKQIGALASQMVDVLLCVGKRSYYMAQEAKKQGLTQTYHWDSLEEFLLRLKEYIKKEDVILVKASNSMGFSKIVEELVK